VTAVADSSPLIILARLDCLDLLKKLFSPLYISTEVHGEVVISGAGLPGSSEVEKAEWIEVKELQNHMDLLAA
jgi:predicted nucleic acid-binding protein